MIGVPILFASPLGLEVCGLIVAPALGHAAEAMTHHYTGVLDASLRDAADRVERALRRTS